MKSNQLMSIPFNGRAHFDQIDFVKCNRVRERETLTSTYARSTSDHRFLRDLRIFNCLALRRPRLSSVTVNFENLFTIFSSIVLTRFVGMLCVIKAGLLSAKIDLQKYTYTQHTFSTLFTPIVLLRTNANVPQK